MRGEKAAVCGDSALLVARLREHPRDAAFRPRLLRPRIGSRLLIRAGSFFPVGHALVNYREVGQGEAAEQWIALLGQKRDERISCVGKVAVCKICVRHVEAREATEPAPWFFIGELLELFLRV